jgi:CRISPR-associated protein Csm3
MNSTQLKSIKVIKGTIEVVTGLRIGGSQETMEISGLDNPIIRNPANAEPFIPGSSIKGRLRSLAEWYFDEVPDGGDVTCPRIESRTARVFGIPAQKDEKRGPTRLIVRDAILSDKSREDFRRGRPITEVKSENSINRLTAMANPRPMERVLPGVTFDCELVYRVFEIDGDGGATDERLFTEVLLVALTLLEADALGGGSSRGNGKVKLALTLDDKPLELPRLSFSARNSR